MNYTRIAEIISLSLHPFVMAALVTIVSAAASGGFLYSAGSLLIILMLVIIPLYIFIKYKVRNKKWENIDASNKHERPSFYSTTIILLILLVIFLSVFSLFAFLVKGILSVIVLLAVHFLINRYIKASLHTAFIVYAAIVIFSFYPVLGIIMAMFIPMLIWARLILKRHTITEIAAGIGTGTASALLVVLL